MSKYNYIIGPTDTDSISFCKPDMSPFSEEERAAILKEINDLSPEFMQWEDDGYYKSCLVIRAKNYVLWDGKKRTIKGSALKASTKEKALKSFIDEVIDLLLQGKKDKILFTYLRYAKEILNLTDMSQWSTKKTVTKSVLNPERTNEQRVLDALEGSDFSEGDKVYMFYKTPKELCLAENFDGVYCVDTLLKKLYKTLKVFKTVIDIELFPDFSLKRNRELLGLEPKKPAQLKLVPPTDQKLTRTNFPEGFWNIK